MQTLTMPAAAEPIHPQSEPLLAGPAEAPADRETAAGLRRFHLAGPSALERPDWTGKNIVPALLHPYRGSARIRTEYPLYVPPISPAGDACLSLGGLLESLGPVPAEHRLLADNLLRWERNARDILHGRGRTHPARDILREAGEATLREVKLGKADADVFRAGVAKLLEKVPADALLVPGTDQAPFELLRLAGETRREAARLAFRKRLTETIEKTMALLEADRRKRPEGRDAGAVQGAMGEVGSRFVNAGALAGMASVSGRGEALPDSRRRNLESALTVLRKAEETVVSPALIFEEEFAALAEAATGWRPERHEDPCQAAARRFDENAEDLARVLRAERYARLELDGAYDPERHDMWLSRLDWRMFSRDELALIPLTAVLVSADHLARRGLPSLSRLLLSGRPVQVVVLENPARNPGAEAGSLAAFRFEPGYLGLSHREAFVQQTSAARPLHMMSGFRRALAGTRCALHVIAAEAEGPAALGGWLLAGAALESRAHPSFHYDPEAGTSWARRLEFSQNPQPEADWPVYDLSAKTESGAKQSLTLAFTFADFALLEPALAGHFRPVPPGVPEADLMTMDVYLRLAPEETAGKIPMVWGVDGEGRLLRLAATRELALAAKDRLDTWRILQELAGVRNEYADEAARKAREETLAQAAVERAALETAHAQELEALRRSAAEEVVTRLTSALLDVDFAELAAPASPLDALRGRSVDEVARALLAAADPNRPEENSR